MPDHDPWPVTPRSGSGGGCSDSPPRGTVVRLGGGRDRGSSCPTSPSALESIYYKASRSISGRSSRSPRNCSSGATRIRRQVTCGCGPPPRPGRPRVFLKPPNQKTFPAKVYASGAALPEMPKDEPVLASEPVEWVAEFRFFVRDLQVPADRPTGRQGSCRGRGVSSISDRGKGGPRRSPPASPLAIRARVRRRGDPGAFWPRSTRPIRRRVRDLRLRPRRCAGDPAGGEGQERECEGH